MIHLVEGFSYSLRGEPREAIKELLPSLLSNNPFLNTVVAGAMAKYGVLEPITDLENVSRELAQILSTPSDPTAQQFAHGAISKMFEDIYDGVYWDAIDSMSKEDQKLLYTMAAYGVPNYSFYGDPILEHLLELDDPNTLPFFQHWASQIDVGAMSEQTVVRCYEIALRGCARFSDAPPQLKITESNGWLAWQLYGEIIFWLSKPGLDKSEVNDKCRRLWEALTTELIYEAVDPLMRFQNSDRSVSLKGGLASRMFEQFREPIRKILEFGLVHLDELTTIFGRGEIFSKKYREEFVVNALGAVGNRQTAELLQPLVESVTLGTLAVESIRKLKSPRAKEIISLLEEFLNRSRT